MNTQQSRQWSENYLKYIDSFCDYDPHIMWCYFCVRGDEILPTVSCLFNLKSRKIMVFTYWKRIKTDKKMLHLIVARTDNTIVFSKDRNRNHSFYYSKVPISFWVGFFGLFSVLFWFFSTAVLIILNSVNMFTYFLLFTSDLCPYNFSRLQDELDKIIIFFSFIFVWIKLDNSYYECIF